VIASYPKKYHALHSFFKVVNMKRRFSTWPRICILWTRSKQVCFCITCGIVAQLKTILKKKKQH